MCIRLSVLSRLLFYTVLNVHFQLVFFSLILFDFLSQIFQIFAESQGYHKAAL